MEEEKSEWYKGKDAVLRWREKNKEQYKERKKIIDRRYYERHKEEVKARTKARYEKMKWLPNPKDELIKKLIEERNYREEKYRALDLEVMKRLGQHL